MGQVADNNGFTPLHFCAYANAVDTCRILLDKGADIDAKSVKGYTAVCSAAEHHKVQALGRCACSLMLNYAALCAAGAQGHARQSFVENHGSQG
jgi:ankyrin repeat protein